MTAGSWFCHGEVITVNVKSEANLIGGREGKSPDHRRGSEGTDGTNYVGKRTRKIDLQGRSLSPGWIDSHVHLTLYGVYQLGNDCKDQRIRTLDDLLTALKRKARRTSRGRGFARGSPPVNELQDLAVSHPVIVRDAVTGRASIPMITWTCGHISVVNGKALKIAGIDGNTPDPRGRKD